LSVSDEIMGNPRPILGRRRLHDLVKRHTQGVGKVRWRLAGGERVEHVLVYEVGDGMVTNPGPDEVAHDGSRYR